MGLFQGSRWFILILQLLMLLKTSWILGRVIIGHCGLNRLKKTAQVHGLKLKGNFKVCKDCAVAKARQKNLKKDWKGGSQVSGERFYLDISSIRDEIYGGSCFWALLVDDCSDYCWSIFLKNKSELKSKVMTLLTDLKIAETNVKYIRCDDSGENKALFDACQAQGYGVKFEFSGPRTPQQNGKVERKFQTFFGRIRAMLNSTGLKDHLRSGVWTEYAMTVTYLSNITSIKEKMICPYQLLFGSKPRLPESLRSFGEIGVVSTKKDIQGKLTKRGTPCMFMGYSINHAHDVYRMLNIETKKIINSRDIIWMNTVYKDWKEQKEKKKNEVDDDDTVEPKIQAANKTQKEVQEEKILDEQKWAKVYRNLLQLESSFNPEAAEIVERIEQGREILLDHTNFAFIGGETVEREPSTFEEAWNHDDPRSQEKCREAINK
jgi:hypothetical protein